MVKYDDVGKFIKRQLSLEMTNPNNFTLYYYKTKRDSSEKREAL